MNLLSSFMGCVYPGSIRTDSIESMDNESPDCRFQVSNVDERGNEVSRGELQLSDKDLIYFRHGEFPTRWPIKYIRRYGYSEQGNIFLFEAGRRCPTGESIFAFRVSRGTELIQRFREKMDRTPSDENAECDNDEDAQTGCQFPMRFHSSQRNTKDPQRPANFKTADENSKDFINKHRNNNKKDASTSTDNPQNDVRLLADPRPLSYTLIDFDTTKALTESAQAHAANRFR